MKPRKPLPPELAQAIPHWFALETPSVKKKLTILREKRLRLLLKHYGLSQNDPSAWHDLSLHLAIKYVPGFQLDEFGKRGRGRPRTNWSAPKPKGKPGPQRKWNFEACQSLLRMFEEGAKQLRERGIIRVTAPDALTAWIKSEGDAQKFGLKDKEIRAIATAWAKRLSDARKFVRISPQK